MSVEEQEKLFSRFSQASPRTHIKYGGSGLGLFISKSLATLQGGAIGVYSEGNLGSTFAFFIGVRMATPPTGHLATHAPQARPALYRTVTTEKAMRAVKLNVLVVEDNLVNQKVLRTQLQKLGWNISCAGDGKEALEWLKESVYWRANDTIEHPNTTPAQTRHEVDIILMDIEMPIMVRLCAQVGRELAADYQRSRTDLLAHV
jgi:CheY-like chemotaxis protein